MKQINNQEIEFLIDLLEMVKRRYSGYDVELENTKLHNVDIYFLQNKLEKLNGN